MIYVYSVYLTCNIYIFAVRTHASHIACFSGNSSDIHYNISSLDIIWHVKKKQFIFKMKLLFVFTSCFVFGCWVLLRPVLGAWTVACTFRCRPWTGSVGPSLRHFRFWRVGLSLGILYLSIFCYLASFAMVVNKIIMHNFYSVKSMSKFSWRLLLNS
jgi:hypothetical protein